MSLTAMLDCIVFDESLQIHPSRLIQFLPEIFFNFSAFNNKTLVHKLHFFIHKKLICNGLIPHNLKDPYCDLLKIKTENWIVMEKFLGALYCTEEIKHIIDGTTCATLQKFLSQSIYECVLKRGNLYKPALESLSVPKETLPINSKILGIGHFILEYLWTQVSDALQQRFIMQFDMNSTWNFRHVIDPQIQKTLFSLIKKLFQQELEISIC